MENALAQLQQGVLGTVTALGEKVQAHFVVHHVDGLLDGVGIVAHRRHAVTDPEQGEDAGELQDFGHGGIGENVATGHEHLLVMAGGQHHQGVHQGVGVVDAVNQGPVHGEVLLTVHFKTPVRTP